MLQDKEQELTKSLETLEKVDGIDVDEAVTTTAPLYRQFVDTFIVIHNVRELPST